MENSGKEKIVVSTRRLFKWYLVWFFSIMFAFGLASAGWGAASVLPFAITFPIGCYHLCLKNN